MLASLDSAGNAGQIAKTVAELQGVNQSMDLDRVAAGFDRIVGSDPPFDQIADGTYFGEGPVWFGDGRFLLWSDIPNNRIMRWDEESARRRYFANPRGMRTAIHGTARGGSSPASTATGA